MPTPAKTVAYNLPTIVLIGRSNVGKSTLFNRLIEENKALVSVIAGTTRTANEGDILWRGVYIRVIDTGGPDTAINEPFAEAIYDQAEQALRRADAVLFVADAKSGILPQERQLADRIRRLTATRSVPTILVANKCDNPRLEMNIHAPEWAKLNLGSPVPVSAVSGRGLGDLLDLVYGTVKKRGRRPKTKRREPAAIRVSLIGKPNVGKSSLFNKLIGEDRVIVSPVAHTTREPFDTTMTYAEGKKNYAITFVDTAGIRRKAKVEGELEREGITRSIERIERSDIILLLLDATEPVSAQDLQLGGLIEQRSKSVIIVVNKWDLADDSSDSHRQEVKERIGRQFPHLDFAPVVFVSGRTGYRIHQLFPLIIEVNEARHTEVPAAELEGFLRGIVRQHRPARGKGTRYPEILGLRQVNAGPPVFEIFIKYRTSLHRSYLNFIEGRLRERFNFTGTPIVIKMTKMKR
ncbi:MAG: GTPase Der [Candidatus Magasanikbacteria bacterium GW2011_GWA2_56_11]|uniref:GTPase Der n=1 Tax=Candidatus Magasanikbacteria bacterium GW2011_GWA2_56_11 TaxID=1619044 RepID=A0A0G2AJY3_9BACT|nr:MAG: GTPase Der [Candidatus Magasanikbacteria bacterium GW2011_GWA2_56_11]